MWFMTLALTCFIAGVSSDEQNQFDSFKFYNEDLDSRYCVGELPWIFTDYEHIGVEPINKNNVRCIQAASNSCATYPIDFSRGVIELNVYLKLLLPESGLTVTVYNEDNVSVIYHELNKFSKEYDEGWNTVFLDIENNNVGYLNFKACVGSKDIILVDLMLKNTTPKYSKDIFKSKSYKKYAQNRLRRSIILYESKDYKRELNHDEAENKLITTNPQMREYPPPYATTVTSIVKSASPASIFTDVKIEKDSKIMTDDLNESSTTTTSTTDALTTATEMDSSSTTLSATTESDKPTTTVPSTVEEHVTDSTSRTTLSATTESDEPTTTVPSTVEEHVTDSTSRTTLSATTKSHEPTTTVPSTVDGQVTDSIISTTKTDTGTTPTSFSTINKSDTPTATITLTTDVYEITNSSPAWTTETEIDSTPTIAPSGTTESEGPTTTVKDTDPPTQQEGFVWSPLIITLVALGSFVALSVTAITAYYCGKNKAPDIDANFIINEEIQPQTMIPRVRKANRYQV